MKIEEFSDTDLWSQFKSGNRDAYKELYFKYYKVLYNYGLKISSDEVLTEDSIQDLFLKLWKNKANLGDLQSVKAYLFTSYSRILIDLINKEKKTFNSADLSLEAIEKNIEDILTAEQITSDQRQTIETALQALSKRQKEVVYLSFYKGLSYKEIAETIPVKYQTIRNCMHEAIKVLRKHIVPNNL